MTILFFVSEPFSTAWTDKIEFWSTSKVTSIWGDPLGAAGIPVKSNLPNKSLSFVKGLSPSKTWIVTVSWLSLKKSALIYSNLALERLSEKSNP